MRFLVFVVLFAVLVLNYETVNGGLVKDFFGKVHDTAHNVREHIEDTLHLNNKKTEDGSKTEKVETEAPKKEDEEKPKEQKVETTTKAETKPTEEPKKENVPETKPTEEPKKDSKPETVTETSTSTTTTVAPATNDDSKDGRENFKGACSTGYQRTPDGRCKPTF